MRTVMILLNGLFLLLLVGTAHSASYSLSISTTARQEQLLDKRYKRTCMDRLGVGQAALPNCAADCSTCTPTAANKQALMENWVQDRLASDLAAILQRKATQTQQFYFQGNQSQQDSIDAITGVTDPDL
jgi:hypothetical protein